MYKKNGTEDKCSHEAHDSQNRDTSYLRFNMRMNQESRRYEHTCDDYTRAKLSSGNLKGFLKVDKILKIVVEMDFTIIQFLYQWLDIVRHPSKKTIPILSKHKGITPPFHYIKTTYRLRENKWLHMVDYSKVRGKFPPHVIGVAKGL